MVDQNRHKLQVDMNWTAEKADSVALSKSRFYFRHVGCFNRSKLFDNITDSRVTVRGYTGMRGVLVTSSFFEKKNVYCFGAGNGNQVACRPENCNCVCVCSGER